MEIKKAKSQKQKLQRVNSILEAAEALFTENQASELPSAIQIANKAGVAKGTLYIYFSTKEAIFLALLERHTQNWIADFESQLRQYESVTVNDICQYLANYWQKTPAMGELNRMADALLINNVEEKIYSSFQTKIINDLKRIVPSVKSLNTDVESSQWLELILQSQQLLTLAWQNANPRHARASKQIKTFDMLSTNLLTPFWTNLVELKKEKPKEKSTWRKLLGN
ncbi:MAG: TetR/AcrR family transcriptional regulator [Gammaproteobacteria bacterium]|nr:TetR/AcrR family transcriptional regulator [Gammaproteobacteria bacterium]